MTRIPSLVEELDELHAAYIRAVNAVPWEDHGLADELARGYDEEALRLVVAHDVRRRA